MAEGARLESVYTATYRGFESPPHRHIRDESLYESTGSFLLYSPQGGMRTPDRGSTTGAASWTDRARSKRAAPQGRAKRVNPPLTAIFEMRACTKVRALFFYILRRGDENPRPGFDNWRSQLDRPRACERAAPQGRAKRVNPPLTAIFKMRACTQVRAFFFYILCRGGAPREKPIPKLILLHPLILFAEVVHQRPDGGQQPAP